METIYLKKCSETAIIPTRATEGAAGCDLYSDCDVTIPPHGVKRVKTGIAIALNDADSAAFIYARSGVASKFMVAPANCVGVVDSDYRGEILVPLLNSSDTPFEIKKGDRIAQLVIAPIYRPNFVECDSLDETARGVGGFGSTGRQ